MFHHKGNTFRANGKSNQRKPTRYPKEFDRNTLYSPKQSRVTFRKLSLELEENSNSDNFFEMNSSRISSKVLPAKIPLIGLQYQL